MLDTILGFSIRDLVLEKPEDVEEFRRMLRELREELRRRETSEKEPQKKE
ncbi:MAG TPA: hypothetical protein PLK36_09820 [Methanoregulaceae archaeon]|nr:hypothetical protein [Methanoregulaceae archaeon]HQN90357.1 hypothetical protein [Methanoregulaceae archaeon]